MDGFYIPRGKATVKFNDESEIDCASMLKHIKPNRQGADMIITEEGIVARFEQFDAGGKVARHAETFIPATSIKCVNYDQKDSPFADLWKRLTPSVPKAKDKDQTPKV